MANLGVNHFVSNITEGLASASKYEISFRSPQNGDDSAVSLMCNVSQLPGRSLQTYENRHHGIPFKLPYTVEYLDISFSFITQIGFKERKFFESWQEKVVNPKTGLLGFYEDYKGDIIINHLSHKDGKADYTVKLLDAYPVNIPEISMGYSMANENVISSVTFTYRNWESIYSREYKNDTWQNFEDNDPASLL